MNLQEQNISGSVAEQVRSGTKDKKYITIIIVFAILAVCGFIFGGVELWQNMKKEDEISKLQSEKNNNDNDNIPEENEVIDEDRDNTLIFQDVLLKNKHVLMMYGSTDGVSGKQLYYVRDCNRDYEKCLEIATDTDMSVINNDISNEVDGDNLFYMFYRCSTDECSDFGNKENSTKVILDGDTISVVDFGSGKLKLLGEFKLDVNLNKNYVDVEVLNDRIKIKNGDDEYIYSFDGSRL